MKKYQVVGRGLEMSGGTIELTGAQASARLHALKHVKGDVYEIVAPVQFKIGEKIGFDGNLPAALADNLKTPAEVKAEEQAAAEAAEKAKAGAQASMEAQLRAGLEKKIRAEIAAEMQEGLARQLADRVQKAQSAADEARTELETEPDEARRPALTEAVLVADGRLLEAREVFADLTK